MKRPAFTSRQPTKFAVGDKIWVRDVIRSTVDSEPSVLPENGVWRDSRDIVKNSETPERDSLGRSNRCQGCNKLVSRRPRCGKLRWRHKCPHGRWCACGDRLAGIHANHNEFCQQCRADEHNKSGAFEGQP